MGNKYFISDSARQYKPTDYAVANGAWESGSGNCWWWLRSPGSDQRDAIEYGDRLIMMYEGRVALDIAGEEKKNLTVEDLLAKFGQATGSSETTDKLLLS